MKKIIQRALAVLDHSERKKLYYHIFFNTLISLLDVAALAILVLIIGVYTHSVHINIPFLSTTISDPDSLILIGVFLILFMAKSLAGYWATISQYKFAYTVAARISSDNLSAYFKRGYEDYTSIDSSVYIRAISQYPVEFVQFVLSGLQQITAELAVCSFTIIAILIYNTGLFLLITLFLLPPLLLIAFLTRRRLTTARQHIKNSAEKMLQHLNEALSAYIESNIDNKEAFFRGRYIGYQKKLNSYLSDLYGTQAVTSRLIEVFAVLSLFTLILANKYLGGSTTGAIINIGAFMAAAYKVIPSLVKISNLVGQVKTYQFTLDTVNKASTTVKKTPAPEHIRSIKVTDLSFIRNESFLFDKLNFEIGPGDIVGLSGASGRGKTTLINILLGFLKEQDGEVHINDILTAKDNRKRYWQDIAYVKQNTFLFSDTIKANITLADTYDDKRLEEVIKAIGLNTMTENLAKGLDTVISENGKNISGGQKQRIAIARALYKNASLLIFDEPFNELDQVSETKILEYLRELSNEGKMIILTTHNVRSFSYCNKVITIG